MEKKYLVKNMHCNSCAEIIERALKDKVNKVEASFSKEELVIDFNKDKISEEEIREIVSKLGYELQEKSIDNKVENIKEDTSFTSLEKTIFLVLGIVIVLSLGYLIYQSDFISDFKNDIRIPDFGEKGSLILLFLAGILAGFHCISMCGSFVISYTTKNAINGHKSFRQHLIYGGSKVFSYAIIGGIFGLIGGLISFSIGLRSWVSILAGLFMLFYAFSMFGLKFFRRFQFNPKFLTRFTSNASASAKGSYKAPLITGLLNGLFIACGPLQAMYLYAAGTGNFLSGMISLAAFGLGTLPIMIGFGSVATVISYKTSAKILKISAVVVLILGLIMINRGLALVGSDYTFENIKNNILNSDLEDLKGVSSNIVNGVQEVNMNVDSSGYSPNSFVLKKGVPVKWNINVKQLTNCNNEIILNEYGIDQKLKSGLNVIEFTPDKTGNFGFSCWMGMLRGTFIVTETGEASSSEIKAATPPAEHICGGGGGSGCGGSCGGSCGGGCGG